MSNPAYKVQAQTPFVILLSEVKYLGGYEVGEDGNPPTFSLQWVDSPDDETFEIKDKKEYDKLLKAYLDYWESNP